MYGSVWKAAGGEGQALEVSGNADGEPSGDGAVAGDADGLGLIIPPPPMTTRDRTGVTDPASYTHLTLPTNSTF